MCPSLTAPSGCSQLRTLTNRRRYSIRASAQIMSKGLPEFGFVFDIDGVLIRGWDVLPNAKTSLKKVHDSGVPYLFVTNNGMDTEDERATILSEQFDIPVTNKSMVLNHSALQVTLLATTGPYRGSSLKVCIFYRTMLTTLVTTWSW